MRDFAAETLSKNGTHANYTMDTLSSLNLKNIYLPENMAVFVPDSSETGSFKINYDGETDHAFW